MQGPGGSEAPTLYLNAAARHYLGLPERTGSAPWEPGLGGERGDLPLEMDSLEGTMQRSHPSWALEELQNEGLPAAREDGVWQGETAILDGQGNEIPVSQVVIAHRDESGEVSQHSTIMRDISERRSLEDQLRREKVLSESILSGLPGIFYMADEEGRLVRWNDRMEAVMGRGPEELDGTDGLSLLPAEEQERIAEAIAKTFSEGSTLVETKLFTVEGETPYLLNGLRVELDDQPYLLGIGLDISKQKQLEAALEREATTDRLTGIANRQRFDSELEQALARHSRYGTENALAMIDLDHFKRVNDAYGHDIGDRVLVELTERLTEATRETDFLARWGGEEFVILLPETDLSEAYQMAERLRQRVEGEPFGEAGRLTISLGVTGFRAGDNPNTLLKRVDDALYEAKRVGRNRVVVDGEVPASGG